MVRYVPPAPDTGWEGGGAGFGRPELADPPGTGRLCLHLLGIFDPQTDLTYQDPDDPLVIERWPKSARPPLINIGGHRLIRVGEEIRFDGTDSQTDEDGVLTSIKWDFGDGTTATGMVVTHTYTTPGLYTVTASARGRTTRRWVRVVTSLDDSALTVVGIEELTGSVEQGWRCRLAVRGDVSNLVPGRGVILILQDTLDRSWRDAYRRAVRDLARRTTYGSLPPPIPNPGENLPHYTELGYPAGGCWGPALAYADQIQTASAKTGVPPNLLLATIAIRSCGNPDLQRWTGNDTCPKAFGLTQLAPGCTFYERTKSELLNPDRAIMALAEELAARYRQCGRWEMALAALFTNDCACDAEDPLAHADCSLVPAIMAAWAEADRAIGGGGDDGWGSVLFVGYMTSATIARLPEQEQATIECVDPLTFLDTLTQRQEAFFEVDADQFAGGGTFMVEPPLRTAQAIHHTLSHHTTVPEWHDVILDWSGPRMAQLTAPEGSVAGAIRAWAQNDFAWAFGDRYGRIRYERRHHYRGKRWYDEIGRYTPVIDPSLAIQVEVTERNLAGHIGWVKLAGTTSTNACQVFGEYPCGGPPEPLAGKWVYETGYVYDDHRVLCAMAAHHYAYLNRRWDLRLTLPWRHDLDLGDVVRFPHRDPSGRYDWRGINAPMWVVTTITHQLDPATGQFLTTITLEQLTYGIPCKCPEPRCPEVPGSNAPCPDCEPHASSCSGQVLGQTWRTLSYERARGTRLINEIVEGDPVQLPRTDYIWDDPAWPHQELCLTATEGGSTRCLACADPTPSPVDSVAPAAVPAPTVRQEVVAYDNLPTVATSAAAPGVLQASISWRDETQAAASWRFGAGDGVAHATILTEQISWVSVLVRSLDGASHRLKIKLRPIAGSPGSTGLLAVVAVDGPPENDPFGFVGQPLGYEPSDREDGGYNGRYGATTILGRVPSKPTDDWLTYEVDLPGSADGRTYAIGFARVIPGPPEQVTFRTTERLYVEGNVTLVTDPAGCDPQVLASPTGDVCCLPFDCRIPGATGAVRFWLGADVLDDLHALAPYRGESTPPWAANGVGPTEAMPGTPEYRCYVASVLSGQGEPHQRVVTAGGAVHDCLGSATLEETPIWTDVTRYEESGAIVCEVEFEWDLDSCVPPSGPIVTPPPYICIHDDKPSPGSDPGSEFGCLSEGSNSASWRHVDDATPTIDGNSVAIDGSGGSLFTTVVTGERLPNRDAWPVSHQVTCYVDLAPTFGKVRLYATEDGDFTGTNWLYLGPSNFLWALDIHTTADGRVSWALMTPGGSAGDTVVAPLTGIPVAISWNRETRMIGAAVAGSARSLPVSTPPPASPFFVGSLQAEGGTTALRGSPSRSSSQGSAKAQAAGAATVSSITTRTPGTSGRASGTSAPSPSRRRLVTAWRSTS